MILRKRKWFCRFGKYLSGSSCSVALLAFAVLLGRFIETKLYKHEIKHWSFAEVRLGHFIISKTLLTETAQRLGCCTSLTPRRKEINAATVPKMQYSHTQNTSGTISIKQWTFGGIVAFCGQRFLVAFLFVRIDANLAWVLVRRNLCKQA
jgi:hypothetical protein